MIVTAVVIAKLHQLRQQRGNTMKTLIKHNGRAPVEIKFVPSTENPNLLRITRVSDVSGTENTMELPVTEDQLRNWLGDGQHSGHLIQHVMPHLDAEQREFLISGCTPEEWARIVGEEKGPWTHI